jgi:hypothetical protein
LNLTKEEFLKRIAIDSDNYNKTVQALKALAHEILWDDRAQQTFSGGEAYFGRKMRTTASNRISPNCQVTPDLVVMQSDEYGLVAEAKMSLPSNEEYRARELQQIAKYDDDLSGWDTVNGRLPRCDLALIVDHFIGEDVRGHVERLGDSGGLEVKRPLSVIAFALMVAAQGVQVISLKLLYGRLTDSTKHEKLARALQIKLEHVVGNPRFSGVRLYDHEPPAPLLMELIHETVNGDLTREERLVFREEGEVRKKVDVRELREQLSECYGPGEEAERVPEIPKSAWVREAMRRFVKLGWASKGDERNTFTYILKRRREPLRQFRELYAEELYKKAKKREREQQDMPLFPKHMADDE